MALDSVKVIEVVEHLRANFTDKGDEGGLAQFCYLPNSEKDQQLKSFRIVKLQEKLTELTNQVDQTQAELTRLATPANPVVNE